MILVVNATEAGRAPGFYYLVILILAWIIYNVNDTV